MTSMSRQSYLSDMLGSPGVLVIFSPCWQLLWINNLICFVLAEDDEISLVPMSCFPCSAPINVYLLYSLSLQLPCYHYHHLPLIRLGFNFIVVPSNLIISLHRGLPRENINDTWYTHWVKCYTGIFYALA